MIVPSKKLLEWVYISFFPAQRYIISFILPNNL